MRGARTKEVVQKKGADKTGPAEKEGGVVREDRSGGPRPGGTRDPDREGVSTAATSG